MTAKMSERADMVYRLEKELNCAAADLRAWGHSTRTVASIHHAADLRMLCQSVIEVRRALRNIRGH
jgi:hypothetical protein